MKKICILVVLAIIIPLFTTNVAAIGVTCTPGIFDVRLNRLGSPDSFTITVGNLDKENGRNISLYLVTPFDFKPRYHEMPNANEMITFEVDKVFVDPNGGAKVKITIDIPDVQENYGKRWEVWIAVEAGKLPGEMIKTKVYSRMLIQTPDALQVNIGVSAMSTLIFLIIGCTCVGAFVWYKIYSMKKDIKRTPMQQRIKGNTNESADIVRRGHNP